jgi:ribose transport system ATP-binding protein
MYILQLQNITKKYPGVVALNDVSLDVIKGEVHALVGENGAGKSTLIKTCTGAVVPDQGKVIIEGKEFSSLTPTSSKENGIAVIYQEFNLVGELSVAENIFLGRAIRRVSLSITRRWSRSLQPYLSNSISISIPMHWLVP